jgi:hypothetical protein
MAKTRWLPSFLRVLLPLEIMGSGSVLAQTPVGSREYRILQQTDARHPPENMPQVAKPLVVAKPVQPYAYGWFGAKPSMHWHRQFGNRRTHTQWTLK